MRRKKYIIAVFWAAVFLTGCQSGEKSVLDADNPVTINVWNYYTGAQQESFNALVSEFNQTTGAELGINVKAFSKGSISDLEEQLFASAEKMVGAEEMPNVFMTYTDTAYELDQMGLLEDLNPYISDEEKDEYIDSFLEEGVLDGDGALKIFPIAKATEVFFLNQTDWQKFADETGVSIEDLGTIEGVVKTAEKYYEWTDAQTLQKEDGKAFFGRDSMANYIVVGSAQLGQPLFERDSSGKIIFDFDVETARKLWDNYYVPFINGYFASAGRFRSDDVKTGTILAFVGSSAGATFFPSEVFVNDDESYPIEGSILRVPGFEGGNPLVVQQGAGMAVTKGTKAQVTASVEFLKWFTDSQRNIRFAVDSGYLPVKKEAFHIEAIKEKTEEQAKTFDTLEIAIEMMSESCASYSFAMDNGVDIRNILEHSLSDLAMADREAVLAEIAEGKTREEAVAEYNTDEHFEEWYENIKERLSLEKEQL